MAIWQGFGSLDLSGVGEEGAAILRPGSHVSKIIKAEIKDSKSGDAKVLHVEFEADRATIREYINVWAKKEQVMEIGQRRLASLLRCSNHPTPDRPGDVKSLIGLTVGIHVEEYEDEYEGKKRMRSRLRERGAFFRPDGVTGGAGSRMPDDDIPF